MAKKPTKPVAKKVAVAAFADAPDKDKANAMAVLTMRPSVNAAAVTVEYTGFLGEQDIGAHVAALSEVMDSLESGDLSHCENMLLGQAHALQSIFVDLARRATKQEYLKQWEGYLRMALKAQNQCRMTLQTLAEIKNPRPVSFVKQANITSGPQQINNGSAATPPQAREKAGERNELLENQHGNYLDTGAQSTAGRADPHMEAVEVGHRAKHA
jgi:hypothetical protein